MFIPIPLTRLAVFLLPAEPARLKLQNLIAELNAEYNGPNFVPHLTIYAAPNGFKECNWSDICNELAASIREFSLRALEFKTSSEYRKSCYLQFETSPEAEKAANIVARKLGGTYSFDPHISVHYGPVPASRPIKFDLERITFTEVWFIGSSQPTTSAEAVLGWKVLAKAPLSSGIMISGND